MIATATRFTFTEVLPFPLAWVGRDFMACCSCCKQAFTPTTIPTPDRRSMSEMAIFRQLSIRQPVFAPNWCQNWRMQDDKKPHPGPWRIMQVNSELAGIIVAAGFVVLAVAGMPSIAPVFLLAALPLGVGVALLLRATRKG